MVTVKKVGTYSGHRDCVYALEKSGDASSFFSASGDGMVVRWSFEQPDEGELVSKVENSVYAMAFDESRNYLILGQNFKGMHVVDLSSKKEIKNIHFSDQAIFDLKMHRDMLLVASGDGKVYVFDSETFQLGNVWAYSDKNARCIAVNPVNGHIAVGYSDHFIRVYNQEKGLLAAWKAHGNSVFSLVYSPEGTELLSGSRDARLKVWNVSDYSLKQEVVAHLFAINHIAFDPKGSLYATASMDKSVKLWDAKSHRLLKVVDKSRHAGHGTSVNKLLWTKHRDWLVSASDDRSISIWNFEVD